MPERREILMLSNKSLLRKIGLQKSTSFYGDVMEPTPRSHLRLAAWASHQDWLPAALQVWGFLMVATAIGRRLSRLPHPPIERGEMMPTNPATPEQVEFIRSMLKSSADLRAQVRSAYNPRRLFWYGRR